MQPTLALALEDFAHVGLTLAALLLVARLAGALDRTARPLALIGALLIVSGGTLKALEKVRWAISGDRTPWMNDSLFLLMSAGFICAAAAIWQARRSAAGRPLRRTGVTVARAAILLLGAAGLWLADGGGRAWFFLMMGATVLANAALMIQLATYAWGSGRRGAAALLIGYLIFSLALNGMGRAPSTTEAQEWAKQLTNTAAAMIFLLGMWHLRAPATPQLSTARGSTNG